MAKSGYFNTSGYSVSDGNRYLTFSWSITSQNIATNTTTISWTLKGAGTSTQYIYSGNFKVVIADQTVYSSATRIKLRQDTVVASGTFTFTHNDDGTKSFSVSAEAGIYNKAVNCRGSGTWTLDTIARASQPSCITYPEHTQNVGNFGDTISIHMNRKSSTFTHTVRYAFGDLSGTCINAETGKATNKDVGTGFKWKIPESFMDKIPSNTSGSGTIYVDTYNGTTLVGTKTCGFTANVPASVKPSCTIQVLDDTNIKDTYGNLVKGLSKLYVKTNFYAAYGSPVDAYNVTANGIKYSKAEIVTGVLTEAGTTTITATVTDKRGRPSDEATASFDVLDYSPPAITALAVHRCNKDGTANDRGEYVEILFSGEVTSLNNKNTATYSVEYKKTSDASWTSLTTDVNGWKPADLNNNYAVYNQSYIFEADSSSSYNVVVSVTDNHKTDSRPTSASTAFTLINYHPEGNALRFGGVAEKENAFQNDLNFIQTGNRYCMSSPGKSGTSGYVLIAKIKITNIYADSPITFVLCQRKSMTPMTVHIRFDGYNDTTKSTLASITYEGTNYGAFLVHVDTLEWHLYVKKVEAWDTITLQDWYTSEYMDGGIEVTFPGSFVAEIPQGLDDWYRATPAILTSIIDCIMPVGFVLTLYPIKDPATGTTVDMNPNNMYPGTRWERIENRFLWACDAKGDIGGTGGEKTVTLKANEMPSHYHGETLRVHGYSGWGDYTTSSYGVMFDYNTDNKYFSSGQTRKSAIVTAFTNTDSTGGDAAHNNMPPYVQVSIWRRTE